MPHCHSLLVWIVMLLATIALILSINVLIVLTLTSECMGPISAHRAVVRDNLLIVPLRNV